MRAGATSYTDTHSQAQALAALNPRSRRCRADAVARRRFGDLAGPFHDERPVFGCVKGTFTVKKPIRSAWQTAVVGGLAAAAFGTAKLIT